MLAHERDVVVARPGRLGLLEQAIDLAHHPFEGTDALSLPGAVLALAAPGEAYLLVARAVQDNVAEALGQVLPGLFQVHPIMLGQRIELAGEPGAPPLAHVAE